MPSSHAVRRSLPATIQTTRAYHLRMHPLLLVAIPLTLALLLPLLVTKTIQRASAGTFEDDRPVPEIDAEIEKTSST